MTRGDAPWSIQLVTDCGAALDRLPHKIAAALVEFVTGTLPTARTGCPGRRDLNSKDGVWRAAAITA